MLTFFFLTTSALISGYPFVKLFLKTGTVDQNNYLSSSIILIDIDAIQRRKYPSISE